MTQEQQAIHTTELPLFTENPIVTETPKSVFESALMEFADDLRDYDQCLSRIRAKMSHRKSPDQIHSRSAFESFVNRFISERLEAAAKSAANTTHMIPDQSMLPEPFDHYGVEWSPSSDHDHAKLASDIAKGFDLDKLDRGIDKLLAVIEERGRAEAADYLGQYFGLKNYHHQPCLLYTSPSPRD